MRRPTLLMAAALTVLSVLIAVPRTASASRTSLGALLREAGATQTCDGMACAGFIPAGGVTIQSADGCNGRVCIHLRGSGLTVDTWWTTAALYYSDGRMCNPTAYFKAKGPNATSYYIVDVVTVPLCKHTDGWWYAYFENGGLSRWQDGTRLGNTWTPNPPLSGFPTELVHA